MHNCIIGTAGHVDHGKTALVQSLTGKNADRLKEEQRRNITIDLGFADLVTDDPKDNFSIIDVPGHKNFIKNMLAGSCGISFVLFIIALDEGVMPQTKEHFQILTHLNARSGIIVYTKKDLVEDELMSEIIHEDVQDLVSGSFLQTCPSIEVSAKTGENIDVLKQMIIDMIHDLDEDEEYDASSFTMPIDRVFSVDGMGTVVTGTLLSGACEVGDRLYIYPGVRPVKVRGIQSHSEPRESCAPGQRVALNLGGVDRGQVVRGDVLTACADTPVTSSVLAKMEVFDTDEFLIKNNSQVYISLGSGRFQGRIRLLEHDEVCGRTQEFICINFKKKLPIRFGEKFIISEMSGQTPVAGGLILDIQSGKTKRHNQELLDYLHLISTEGLPEVVLGVISRYTHSFVTVHLISQRLNLRQDRCDEIIKGLCAEGKIYQLGDFFASADVVHKLDNCAEEVLGQYHKCHPEDIGLDKATFLHKLQESYFIPDDQLSYYLDYKVAVGAFHTRDDRVWLEGFVCTLQDETTDSYAKVMDVLEGEGFQGAEIKSLQALEKDKSVFALRYMLEAKHVIKLDKTRVIKAEYFQKALSCFTELYREKGIVSLAEFRDKLGISRKYAQILLEAFDAQGLTRRLEDGRILVQ